MTVAAIAIADKQSVGAPIIAYVDTSPVFKFTEHILDFAALAIEAFVEACGEHSALPGRNAGRDALPFQGGSILVTVITFIADHAFSMTRKHRIFNLCADMIAHLTLGKTQDQRSA
jgi:hypothetical protein